QALDAVKESQQWQLKLVDSFKVPNPALDATLSRAFLPTGHLVESLAEMASMGRVGAVYRDLVDGAARVALDYDQHFRHELSRFNADLPAQRPRRLGPLVNVGATSARCVSTARLVVTAKAPGIERNELIPLGTTGVEEALAQLGGQLIDIWNGAWDRVQHGGTDWWRAAAHEGRELLSQVLHALAPDTELKAGDQRVTREMRVMHIVGGDSKTTNDLAKSLTAEVERLYDYFSAEAHSRDVQARVNQQAMAGLLMTTGGVIVFLAAMRTKSDRSG
ncbi:MAG: pPIWI-associating nuclease domain-containing protein, partial [Chloroflexota bacterium]